MPVGGTSLEVARARKAELEVGARPFKEEGLRRYSCPPDPVCIVAVIHIGEAQKPKSGPSSNGRANSAPMRDIVLSDIRLLKPAPISLEMHTACWRW